MEGRRTLNPLEASSILAWPLGASRTYSLLRKQWSRLINSECKHSLSAAHHLLYLALLGKDWRKRFTPPTNRRKLENGAFSGWKLFKALYLLHSTYNEAQLLAPFEGLITSEMLAKVRRLLPQPNPYAYAIEQFAAGNFPFEAYTLPEI